MMKQVNNTPPPEPSAKVMNWLIFIRAMGYVTLFVFLFLLLAEKGASDLQSLHNKIIGVGAVLFLGAIFYYGFGKGLIHGWDSQLMRPFFRPYIVGGVLWGLMIGLPAFFKVLMMLHG